MVVFRLMQVKKFRKVNADLLLNEMKLSLVILSVYEQLYIDILVM